MDNKFSLRITRYQRLAMEHAKTIEELERVRAELMRAGKAYGILRDELSPLVEELERVKRERDAAVDDVKSLCATNYFSGDFCVYCKYREPDGQCFHDCTPYSNKWGWEWRGVQEVAEDE